MNTFYNLSENGSNLDDLSPEIRKNGHVPVIYKQHLKLCVNAFEVYKKNGAHNNKEKYMEWTQLKDAGSQKRFQSQDVSVEYGGSVHAIIDHQPGKYSYTIYVETSDNDCQDVESSSSTEFKSFDHIKSAAEHAVYKHAQSLNQERFTSKNKS